MKTIAGSSTRLSRTSLHGAMLVALAGSFVFITGCSRLVKGEQVVEFRGSGFDMRTAKGDGQYAIFNKYSNKPRGAYNLRKGERIGFDPGPVGRVRAVAGNNEIDLEDGWYVWKYRPLR